MDYLKDKQEYIDRHDLTTIEECLRWYWDIKDAFKKDRNNKEFKKYDDEEFEEETEKVLSMMLKNIMQQRFRDKSKTIDKWMVDDKSRQDKQDNTPEPIEIKCIECGSEMKVIMKDLENAYEEKPYMRFMFECVKCQKRRSIYEDGSEWVYKKPKCPKCNSELKTDLKIDKKADTTTFIESCTKCSYKDVDVSDHKKWKQEQEAREKRNKELLEKHRDQFCYSDEKGKEMVDVFDAMKFAQEVYDYEKSKYDDPAFEKVTTLKKIGIVEVEKLLSDILDKEKYVKFSTDKPEIDRFVIVPFSLQDSDILRSKQENLRDLEKLIIKTLDGTNWRLLSGSLMSRLGFISGKLKGYERDEDLLEISGYKKEKEKKKLDPEKLAKFTGNNIVGLARLNGEFDGVESMRSRRLLKEPNGFLLEDTGSSYSCTVCGQQTPTGSTWWFPHARWCVNCKKNIDDGVIPKLVGEERHEETWLKEYDLEYHYGLKKQSVRKLEKEGLLHPRKLVSLDGWTYCSIYLMEENKEFLEKYPRVKKNSPEITRTGANNEEVKL